MYRRVEFRFVADAARHQTSTVERYGHRLVALDLVLARRQTIAARSRSSTPLIMVGADARVKRSRPAFEPTARKSRPGPSSAGFWLVQSNLDRAVAK